MNNSFRTVTVKSKGTSPSLFMKEVTGTIHFEFQEELNNAADSAVNRMRETIKSNKIRHSLGSNLEDTIEKEIINAVGGLEIGIGNINKLTTDAPYWEVLNNGGYVPYSTSKGAPLGTFEGDKPDANAGGVQNWERSGAKGYFMRPNKPISPVRYIEIATEELNANIEKAIANLMKKEQTL